MKLFETPRPKGMNPLSYLYSEWLHRRGRDDDWAGYMLNWWAKKGLAPERQKQLVDENTYTITGDACGRYYDTVAVVSQDDATRVELTDGNETFAVEPRYVGSDLTKRDMTEGTICAFHHNGEYVALATFDRTNQTIKVYEY